VKSEGRRPRKKRLAYEGIALLTEKFPAAFGERNGARRPLKIGIDIDILADQSGFFISSAAVRAALGSYTNSYRYLISMQPGAVRVDLFGQPAGVVTEEEAACARQLLAEKVKPQYKSAASTPPFPTGNRPHRRLKALPESAGSAHGGKAGRFGR
jgi:sRNA-binding protein